MEKAEKNSKYSLTIPFIKELATYFMDFLETDFHKRRSPKRKIILRTNDNLLSGINVKKYPSFYSKILTSISRESLDTEKISTINKGVYKCDVPKNLTDVIQLQLKRFTKKNFDEFNEKAKLNAEEMSVLHKENVNSAISKHTEFCLNLAKDNFVSVFVNTAREPLLDSGAVDENDIYAIEEDILAVIQNLIDEKISKNIKNLVSKLSQEDEILDLDFEYLSKDDFVSLITQFFNEYKLGDLYLELDELDRNKRILDKQELYLNIGDIYFEKNKYPIFYIPIQIEKNAEGYKIVYETQLYINKKALEYIEQEYNTKNETHGHLDGFKERIVYLSQCSDLSNFLKRSFDELVDFFQLNEGFDLTNQMYQISRSRQISISNNVYITLFDKADESLINDYESILDLINNGGEGVAELFKTLIDGFFFDETESINAEIEDGWDGTSVTKKLVMPSPIPLNSEQRKILKAIEASKGKYYVVQGPPGTGKSHTITAIVFESLLKGNSVLVLSDKDEALDVVENKITETLNKIRKEKNFQNPILRLGRSSKAYTQILATQNIEKIKQHYKVVRNKLSDLDSDIQENAEVIESNISNEIDGYSSVDIKSIRDLHLLEKYFDDKGWIINKDYVNQIENLGVYISDLNSAIESVRELTADESAFRQLVKTLLNSETVETLADIKVSIENLSKIRDSYNEIKDTTYLSDIAVFGYDDYEKAHKLTKLHEQFLEIRNPLLGYLFRKNDVEKLTIKFNKIFPNNKVDRIEKNLDLISKAVQASNAILDKDKKLFSEEGNNFNLLSALIAVDADESILTKIERILEKAEDVDYLLQQIQIEEEESVVNEIGLTEDVETISSNKLTTLSENSTDFSSLVRYFTLYEELTAKFESIKSHNFNGEIKSLEEMVSTKMSFILDERVVDFYENNRSSARVLREVIRKKQKFPQEEFEKLKSAFPCIISSIRDYAEYIPLQQDLFDLVIIDEASQVSIAQALPAILRAKKILVLGDQRQFSNVKANQAKSDTNQDYLNKLNNVYQKNVSTDPSELVKLGKFNIKTSVLEFFEFISNFNIQLTKHFRGYKELISYSNKFFYQNNLQVMKIRAKKIDEVLKFTQLEIDEESEIPNTNIGEIEFIITQLEEVYRKQQKHSIGIITPHTNQQKLLAEKINELEYKDYLYDENMLKIMTFDTCQGEERDTIYYSMVATKNVDRLWGVFIKDLSSVDVEEEGKIKAQRLNVGFSRAKECMHFVISKPVEEFNGSIGEALRHYAFTLSEAKTQKDVSTVDNNSPMEAKVLEWFYQTKFYNENKENIEFLPQFELGEYLKQLDSFYSHPKYVVDFLLVYKDPLYNERKIIIEYDGFQEHFSHIDEVNEFNYESYYSEDDIYRQKVLESYGYRFLRINRFNLTEDPVATLNTRLIDLVNESRPRPALLENISNTIHSLQNGDMIECPKCNEIKPISEFKDSSLISGMGRYCRKCKGKGESRAMEVDENVLCPTCNSRMVLRSGRYGRFYGCSRFPYCRGTRRL